MREQPFLPRRHSVRLPTFDYSQPAGYFVTICTQDRRHLFGHVENRTVTLNALGQIAESCWRELPAHFAHVELAPHVVMPNHVHGIVYLRANAGDGSPVAKHLRRAQHAAPLRQDGGPAPGDMHGPRSVVADSIPAIVRSFKSAVSKCIRENIGKPQFQVWQRGYYEHIIRDEDDFQNTCEYIRMNPARWEFDEENS